ncbi:hypothetical protein Cni_G14745 [Canna indica]|uniref:Uncharacterized protein n=1 Tax=Canna indica TaxID=4628 RepID=A0AAQ3QE96_9LILI|nr:hypothetical protein Cni_G14745 [Canna indica]
MPPPTTWRPDTSLPPFAPPPIPPPFPSPGSAARASRKPLAPSPPVQSAAASSPSQIRPRPRFPPQEVARSYERRPLRNSSRRVRQVPAGPLHQGALLEERLCRQAFRCHPEIDTKILGSLLVYGSSQGNLQNCNQERRL